MFEGLKYAQEVTHFGALVGGMILQYIFGETRGTRVLILVVVSSLFLALFVLSPLMDVIDGITIFGQMISLDSSSPIRTVVYALSALISIEVISMLIKVLPSAVRVKILDKMGVKDEQRQD